ncbi:MAG: hypothetical protein CMJ76_09350 [Planctomycetaceae bacterium]|nr:hypothetical protein [Planctomycetaceae bacterium]
MRNENWIRIAWFGIPEDTMPLSCLPAGVQITEVYKDPLNDPWESVLANRNIDVVVFGITQSSEEYQNILRILMQNQIPVAIPNPDADSLFAYEIEMVRVDAGARLSAIIPKPCDHHFDATTVQAQAQLQKSDLNDIYHHLTHDLLYLDESLGTPKYVFAMGARVTDDVRNLTVNVEFESGCLLNWGVGNPLATSRFNQNDKLVDFSRTNFSTASILRTLQELQLNTDSDGSWVKYSTTREAAELISLSLKKGRRIEIFEGNPTERDSFKGVMSTAGCFILLLALTLITALAAIDIGQISETRDQHLTALETNNTTTQRWPLWIRLWPVYPLALFLSFQFLKLLIRTESKAGNSTKDASSLTADSSSD